MNAIPPGWRFEVSKGNLSQSRWEKGVGATATDLAEGEVLLAVDRFGFTANNITYAIYGYSVGYWSFFPASDGYGIIPVWGFADVVASRCSGVLVGERVFGYLPMAAFLIARPEQIDSIGFRDGVTHRAALPPTYNEYRRVTGDPTLSRPNEARQMVLKPLLMLSWLVADMLAEANYFGAKQIVITGASSRTALGLAKALQNANADVRLIGLTSCRNRAFVDDRGVFDTVADYDDVPSVPYVPTCIVDIAGRHSVLHALHRQLKGTLLYSMRVGDLAQSGNSATNLLDPQPILFFAPDQIRKRRSEWGRANYDVYARDTLAELSGWIMTWLKVREYLGRIAISQTYRNILLGNTQPHEAAIFAIDEKDGSDES